MRLTTKQAARGKWDGILVQLIGEEAVTRKHGPCPICGGKDRYRYDNKRNDGDWFCNVCGVGDGFSLLQQALGITFAEAARRVDEIVNNVEEKPFKPVIDTEKRRVSLNKVWADANAPEVVSTYLQERGIRPDIISEIEDVRGHPALPLYDGSRRVGDYPAMIALIRDNKGEPVTIHRTYLMELGKKAKKIMPSLKTINGCAVRLGPISSTLCLAEGIESALAMWQTTGIGAWATISAHGMEEFKSIPRHVTRVLIAADNDLSFTGQGAAFKCAAYLKRKFHIPTEVWMPALHSYDMADYVYNEGPSQLTGNVLHKWRGIEE